MNYPETPHLVYDFKTGDVIDPLTGVVVDRIYVSTPYRKTEEGYVFDASIIPFSDEMNPLHLPRTSYEFMHEVIDLYYTVKALIPIYGMPQYLLEMNARFYLRRLKGMPHTDEMKAALLYVILEQNEIIVDEIDFSKAVGIPLPKLRSAIMAVKRRLDKANKHIPFRTRVVKLILYYGRKFDLPADAISKAVRLYKSKPVERFTPRSIALATIYIAMQKSLTFKEFVKMVGASENLRRAIKCLRKAWNMQDNAGNRKC